MRRRFLRFPGFKLKALTLSYDDGVRQDKRFISILNKHGIKCTFNINFIVKSTKKTKIRF